MLFLTPNQQCQSTEDNLCVCVCVQFEFYQNGYMYHRTNNAAQ